MSITKTERIEGNDREAEDAIFQDLRGKLFFAITENLEYTSNDPEKYMYIILSKQYSIVEVIHVIETLLNNIMPMETLQ